MSKIKSKKYKMNLFKAGSSRTIKQDRSVRHDEMLNILKSLIRDERDKYIAKYDDVRMKNIVENIYKKLSSKSEIIKLSEECFIDKIKNHFEKEINSSNALRRVCTIVRSTKIKKKLLLKMTEDYNQAKRLSNPSYAFAIDELISIIPDILDDIILKYERHHKTQVDEDMEEDLNKYTYDYFKEILLNDILPKYGLEEGRERILLNKKITDWLTEIKDKVERFSGENENLKTEFNQLVEILVEGDSLDDWIEDALLLFQKQADREKYIVNKFGIELENAIKDNPELTSLNIIYPELIDFI
jgi:hypothetical protein